jgi:SAM-dependent methyltransferase
MMNSADDEERNVRLWTRVNAEHCDAAAIEKWNAKEICWGLYETPESQLNAIGDVSGLDALELGCGTAFFCAWLAKRGARVVGVDPTPAQLETARRLQKATGIVFPLVEANAEKVPLPDGSFDLIVSEYGASHFADPHLWIKEAARLLRPNGRLLFFRSSTLAILCMPHEGLIKKELLRPQFGLGRLQWEGDEGVEYHLGHGEWIDVLREAGLAVERLIEVRAPESARTHDYYTTIPVEWARNWPAEELWVAKKSV